MALTGSGGIGKQKQRERATLCLHYARNVASTKQSPHLLTVSCTHFKTGW